MIVVTLPLTIVVIQGFTVVAPSITAVTGWRTTVAGIVFVHVNKLAYFAHQALEDADS
jgi:hypothetical protein